METFENFPSHGLSMCALEEPLPQFGSGHWRFDLMFEQLFKLSISRGRCGSQSTRGSSPGEGGEERTTREGECTGEQQAQEPLPAGCGRMQTFVGPHEQAVTVPSGDVKMTKSTLLSDDEGTFMLAGRRGQRQETEIYARLRKNE